MTAADLAREVEQRCAADMKAKGVTITAYRQSPGYAEGYAVGMMRRLTLNILADHGVGLDEFMARVNAHGVTFAQAVDAVAAEIEAAA